MRLLYKPKLIGLAGLATTAVLAIGAVGASAASAAEFTGPFPNSFTSSGGTATLETVSGIPVTCTGTTDTGTITGAKTGETTVSFQECAALGVLTCTTAGAAEGEIKTKLLATTVGDLAGGKVGIALEKAGGGALAEFECEGGISIVVTGSVIGEITPVGVATNTYTLTFNQAGGVQEFTELEGVPDILETSVNGGAPEQSGEQVTDTLKTTDTTELKA